jgi:hypothetical protein
MASIGVIKGQPYRFGIFDQDVPDNESATIHFISKSSLEQKKSAPPISRVKAKDAFLSVDLSLCKLLCDLYSDPFKDAHAAGLWRCISPKVNTVVFVNRQYVLNQIQLILPNTLDDAQKKLESRRLLFDLESAWNTSILQPQIITALLCSHGWNAKTQTLYTMPYRSPPLGRIEGLGSPVTTKIDLQEGADSIRSHGDIQQRSGTTGLIYKPASYAEGSFNVDLSASEATLSSSTSKRLVHVIYVDSLGGLKPETSWPQLLSENLSKTLSDFIRSSNILVIDAASKAKLYSNALNLNFKVDSSQSDHVLPCCSFRQQEILGGLEIDTLSAFTQDSPKESPLDCYKDKTDLSAFTRAFHDLYPAYIPGDSLPGAIVTRAFAQFGFSLEEPIVSMVLSGRAELPSNLQSPSTLYLVHGLLRILLERIIRETSPRLLIRKSDLDANKYDLIRDGNNGADARLIRVSSQAGSVQSVGLDMAIALDTLRSLRNKQLENPYKLAKLIDMQLIKRVQDEDPSSLSIILLEDH